MVFSITQAIVYLWILPRQTYLKAATELSCVMLELTHKYTNFTLTSEEIERIRKQNASYLSAIINSGAINKQRTRKNGLKVSRNINGLIALSQQPNLKNRCNLLQEFMEQIISLDKNVIIEYSDIR